MMLQDKLFKEMCRMVKADEFEFVCASHKRPEARFIFRDASGCPFSYDMFSVVTWNKYNGIKFEIQYLWQLNDYEKSKLPESFWELYNADKQQKRKEAVA